VAGTFPKPLRKGTSITDFLDIARLVLDAALTETTQAHRDDGFQGAEVADPDEFNYIFQRWYKWALRNGVTLVAEHRTAEITVGGAVTPGDTRRFSVTSPVAFNVDYATQASDASNNDIAANWAAAINDDATAQKYVKASASGAVVTVEWLVGLEAVAWGASVTVSVGAPTAVLAETVSDTYIRVADDDSVGHGLIIGSTSTEDLASGTDGDLRMFYDAVTGSFRAGWCTGAQWDIGNRGIASTALGKDTTASGDYSVASGNGSSAAGDNALAHGLNASADFDNAIALGDGATVNGIDGVAIGDGAQATSGGVAAGPGATAGASQGVAIGDNATVSGGATDAVAIGHDSTSSGVESTAVAPDSFAGGDRSLAAGHGASAPNDDATAVGYNSTASGQGATGMGVQAQATATGALAMGAHQSPVTGPSATASAAGAVAIGAGASTATSDETEASAMGAVAIGRGCDASAAGLAVGDYALCDEDGLMVLSAQPILSAPAVAADRGSAQGGQATKVSQTTDGSTVVLGGAATTFLVPTGVNIHVHGHVIAANGTDGRVSRWTVEILARNIAGTVTLAIATTSASGGDVPAGTIAVATPTVVAGSGVKIDVTGTAAKDVNWIGQFKYARIVNP